MKEIIIKSLTSFLLVLVATSAAYAERIKDIATVAGVRSNQLVGYGLVVGLDGTGDQTSQAPFTTQSLKSMLAQFDLVYERMTIVNSIKSLILFTGKCGNTAFCQAGSDIGCYRFISGECQEFAGRDIADDTA